MGNLNGYDKIQAVLKKTVVFLFPTSSEGLPRSLIEAMANSCAAVSTPIDGIVELLSDEYLADYRDTDDLYSKVKNLLMDGKLRQEAATVNYQKARKYRIEELTQRRNAFYFKLGNLCR